MHGWQGGTLVGPFGFWRSPEPGLAVARRVWVSDPTKDTQPPRGQGIRVCYHTDRKIKQVPSAGTTAALCPSNRDVKPLKRMWAGSLLTRVIRRMAWHLNTGVPAPFPPKQSSPRHLMGVKRGMYEGEERRSWGAQRASGLVRRTGCLREGSPALAKAKQSECRAAWRTHNFRTDRLLRATA